MCLPTVCVFALSADSFTEATDISVTSNRNTVILSPDIHNAEWGITQKSLMYGDPNTYYLEGSLAFIETDSYLEYATFEFYPYGVYFDDSDEYCSNPHFYHCDVNDYPRDYSCDVEFSGNTDNNLSLTFQSVYIVSRYYDKNGVLIDVSSSDISSSAIVDSQKTAVQFNGNINLDLPIDCYGVVHSIRFELLGDETSLTNDYTSIQIDDFKLNMRKEKIMTVQNIITAIVEGATGILSGIGAGAVDFFESIFLTTEGGLSALGTYLLVFVGIGMAIGIMRWIRAKVG
jgi:hypothetical protein